MKKILKILIFTVFIFLVPNIQAKTSIEKTGMFNVANRMTEIIEIAHNSMTSKEHDEAVNNLLSEFKKFNNQGVFKKKKLRKYVGQDLNIIYKFSSSAVFYFADNKKVDILRNVFNELKKRGKLENEQIEDFYDALIKMRRFKEAEKIYKEYSDITIVKKYRTGRGGDYVTLESKLEKMPKVKTSKKAMSAKRRIYHVSSDGNEITMQSIDIEKGPKIIVIGRCHFSDDALRAIGKNKKLNKIFKKYGVFLANGSDFKGIAKWNSNEMFKYAPIYLEEDWPGLVLNTFPTFYFLKDGKIVHTFNGWSKEGNFDEIYKGLKKLGLSEAK